MEIRRMGQFQKIGDEPIEDDPQPVDGSQSAGLHRAGMPRFATRGYGNFQNYARPRPRPSCWNDSHAIAMARRTVSGARV